MPAIRRGDAEDLQSVAAIQSTSPEAAQWPVTEYLQYELAVFDSDGVLAGFVVWRTLAPGECEVLNLVVAPEFRRRGIARQLLAPLVSQPDIAVFLEVRESNQAARFFYKSMGFKEVNARQEYYTSPVESAIVMKFHSC
jgi:[ribosomal protein S18]-alanine N-acetyltransferase